MKLKDIPKSELELMGYDDIAYVILSESKKKLKINELFKKICDALEMSEEEYQEHLADFFDILSTDKKFVMLENGCWDLRTRHSEKLVIEDDDEDFEEEEVNSEEDSEKEEDSNFYDEEDDETDDDTDDLKDLVVIDEEEES
ncbi:MAG: DNA-directed RNA polymerase subunit delta [Bacilli bacterium]|nr:DNA-directed RNA polymerase subunit delta [Bacilli bacterium]MBR1817438.1 DNA-directed RNA polymerase subunit delta [Bacilli bacterium]